MSYDFEPGHGPTETDEANALVYATMNMNRNICLSDPVNYVWKESPVVGYPCPEGLTCYSGICDFSKQGCKAYSNLPYLDCKRKTVPCGFPGGTCDVCTWELIGTGAGGIPCPVIGEPQLTDADATTLGDKSMYCRPGDSKIVPTGTYKPTPTPDPCRPAQPFACPGLPDGRKPYLVDGQKVPCKCDDDCALGTSGLAGTCNIETATGPQALPSTTTCNDTTANAFCYPPDNPYTEWREGYTAFQGADAEDACVITFSNAKQWCEMPWTRYVGIDKDGNADPACWKTLYKQPFYYHEEDGKCYVTKSYCMDNLGDGGFDGSFGLGHDYKIFNTCTTPQGSDNEVQPGYDCCTSLGASIAQFFFGGDTIPAEWDNLREVYGNFFSGQSTNTYCSRDGATAATASSSAKDSAPSTTTNNLEPLVSFLSDERLKTNVKLHEEDGCGMGISVYHYEWTPEAKRLYKKPDGVVEGLMMSEIEKVFPQHVRLSQYGHKVFAHIPDIMPQAPDVKAMVYLSVMLYLMGSSDVVTPDEI